MKKKRSFIKGTVLVLIGLAVGWLFFAPHNNSKQSTAKKTGISEKDTTKKTIWTCAMHPQIRQDHPGQCPICGMTLIPISSSQAHIGANEIQMSMDAIALANVQTTQAFEGVPERTVYLTGTIKADESLIAMQAAHIPGRIDRLFVNFTGQQVRKGEKLAMVYSPELIIAEKELLEAIKYQSSAPGLVQAAIDKLKSWKLTDAQIAAIRKSGTVQMEFNILADFDGIVSKRIVSIGDYIKEGSPLLEIENLGHIWVLFDAYQSDLPWIKTGDKINFTVNSMPGKTFSSSVTFIDPVINAQTRVASVRTELNNPGMQLKSDMFATGILAGRLPVKSGQVLIPKTAVLWTGKRAVAYVKDTSIAIPTFQLREITLGSEAGDNYVVEQGLRIGEPVVTNGVFEVDAAAQLAGRTSMMNPVNESKATVPIRTVITRRYNAHVSGIFNTYLQIKNALVQEDSITVAETASRLRTQAQKITDDHFNKDEKDAWSAAKQDIEHVAQTMGSTRDIKQQHKQFISLSNAMTILLEQFKLQQDKNIYILHCPMANGNGANWLDLIPQVKNPYLGPKMLGCGDIVDTIKN